MIKDNTGKNEKGLRRSEGPFVPVNLLRAQEEQHEGKQNQRLNESQSDEKCKLDAGTRSGVPGKSFSH